jgi:hypothetical protein
VAYVTSRSELQRRLLGSVGLLPWPPVMFRSPRGPRRRPFRS